MNDNTINQSLKAKTPPIEQQIDFIRGARHFTAKGIVQLSESDNSMLMAIEETLIAANNWHKLLTKVKDEANGEVNG